MSHHRNYAAWLLLFGILVVVAGCGQEKTTSPLNQTPDAAPPTTPSGMVVSLQTDTKFTIEWTPCTEVDLAGYRVYKYDPDPSRESAYVAVNQTPLAASRITFAGTPNTTYFFRVSAVDASSNESGMSEPFSFTFEPSGGTQSDTDGSGNVIWRGGNEVGPDHRDQYQVGELPIHK